MFPVPPCGLLWKKNQLTELKNHWYSRQLCAMGEGPLRQPRGRGSLRLRLVKLPSFAPAVMVRIDHTARKTTLTAIELDGAGGRSPGKIARKVSRVLTEEEWQTVVNILERDKIRRLPQDPPPDLIASTDGTQWVLEVSDSERHQIVDRHDGNELVPLGRHLLALAGW